MSDTAAEPEVSEAELKDLLQPTFLGARLEIFDGQPDNAAYFADSPVLAADWAMWGSESEAEADAAINARHSPEKWKLASQGFNWTVHERQHEPTVIAVDIEWEEVRRTSLKPERSLDGWRPPPFHRIRPEVRIPVPTDSINIVAIRPVEPILKTADVEKRFGLRFGEVDRAIEAGRIPHPDDRHFDDRRWWESTLA